MEKYVGKGYTGLKNLGNTCFINSCLQVLSHTYELSELIHDSSVIAHIKPDTPESILLKEYRDLIDLMWSRNGVVGPNRFIHVLHHVARHKNKEIFTGFAQNDTSELLQFLIDCFHESISRAIPPAAAAAEAKTILSKYNFDSSSATNPSGSMAATSKIYEKCTETIKNSYEKEYSEIVELFYGLNLSKILAPDVAGDATAAPLPQENHELKVLKPEPFFILNVPIPPSHSSAPPTLYDCIKKFTEVEVLSGENKWYNEENGTYEDVLKKYDIFLTPQILVILINRFSQDPNRKNETLVQFPHELFLDAAGAAAAAPTTYDLYGVCNHIGNAMFGHYTSFVKNASGEWLFYNDSDITKVASPDHVVTPMAYCLFYRRRATTTDRVYQP